MVWLLYLLALGAGAANPFQSGTNAELNRQLGQPVWAGVVVYASGLAGLLLLQAFVGQALPSGGRAAQVHWWAWLGGVISIGCTMAGLMLAQRLGSGAFTGLSITAALITSVVLDHFGLIGFRQHTASLGRIVGCGLLIGGVWLIAQF